MRLEFLKSTPAIFTAIFGVTVLLSSGFGCAHSGGVKSSSTVAGESQEPTADEKAERLFEILDVDGNGKITAEEAKSGFRYLIASYDRGGKTEILAAKPGSEAANSSNHKSAKRRPTNQDADKAFAALFDAPSVTTASISKEEFRKLVVRASDNADSDPFAVFY